MIYITQGHERGIGLEVLFKSLLCLSANEQKKFKLFCFKTSAIKTLESLKISYKVHTKEIEVGPASIACQFLTAEDNSSETMSSMLHALKIIKKQDILITLPSSKDAFVYHSTRYGGHTEFFRKFYKKSELAMLFYTEKFKCIVLSDHDPLTKVAGKLSQDFVYKKIKLCLKTKHPMLTNAKQYIFAGINPHAGEAGLIGSEDTTITGAIEQLKLEFKDVEFIGPLSGDTLFFKNNPDALLVYTFHDQGLGVFKSQNGLLGINATVGLPFVRLSVDHGTAFELFGKNLANYQGCLYQLKAALTLSRKK
ncbi:MAG: 4-hydroxythreonine-4-phosphate dehydrogenase PdxA [Bacteriovoracaceae bacterium]|nr:4-hydroxythreonine-4-phosphate dehydrogenase PdxA [Bacteriovoracaceae bacterium]